MKLKLYAVAGLVAVTALISCAGSNESDYVDKSIIPPGSENKTAQPADPNATTQNTAIAPANALANAPVIPGVANQPQTVSVNPQNNVVTTPLPAEASVAPGMNPPHGQPGHRCDIAVGQPLNSKPAAPATTTAQPVALDTKAATPNVTMTEVPNTQKTAPGMNPPHGEPGHRCDIAVGQPLDSKPAPATATAQPTVVNTQPVGPAGPVTPTQVTAPQVTTTQTAATTKTAPGMNPPHGEPNHRCDIAVGAPLDSKPAAVAPVETKTPPPLLTAPKADPKKN